MMSRPAGASAQSSRRARRVRVAGRRAALRLEPTLWEALEDVAARKRQSLDELIAEIDRTRTAPTLSGAVAVFLLEYYRRAVAAL